MSRRMNGEGYLRRRADGRWELRVMVGHLDNGKNKYKNLYGRTKKEVLEKLNSFRDDQRCGIDTSHNYTFSEWSEFWYENHRSNITPTTQENYRIILNHIKPFFADRFIGEIKPHDIEAFLKFQRAKGLSDSYLSSFRGMLYQIFHKAEANDLIRKNPVRFAEKMRSRGQKQRKEAFDTDEVRLLMENLPTDKMGLSIRLMLGTGMRTQEVLALEPRHIEEDGSVIHIQQAVNLVKGSVHVGEPKSRDSYRDIPVPPNLRWCAKELRMVTTKFIWEVGKKDTPCNPSYFRNKFKETVSEVEGVRCLTPHSCRHTYVSQMQALGVDLQTIRSIVGHADIDMTQHYLHVQEGVRQEAIQKFSEAFPVDGPEPQPPEARTCKIILFPSVG